MTAYPLTAFVKSIQVAFDVEVTGVAGLETLYETITLSEVLNRKHPAIYAIQRRLAALGYTEVGKINGVADARFTSAVKHFQVDNGYTPTGEITARDSTWKKLLGME